MDKILSEESPPPRDGEYGIWDYYRLLDDLFKKRFNTRPDVDLTWVALGINHEKASGKCMMPFEDVVPNSSPMKWWSAHNKLKHSDIDNSSEGNFRNAFNALAGVAFLLSQCLGLEGRQTRLFGKIGFFLPPRPPRTLLLLG
jgi:hypothetical protein